MIMNSFRLKTYFKEVFEREKYWLGRHHALKGEGSVTTQEIHRRITQDAPSNSFSKNDEKSQPQPQRKGRHSIIVQAMRIGLLWMK